MSDEGHKPIKAASAPPRTSQSNYPEPFATRMAGRFKRPLGDLFGIEKFGVNFTELLPGAESAVLHKHSKQEEFIFVLSGHPTLSREDADVQLSPGDCVGFTPKDSAHMLKNRTQVLVTYLEIGDRISDDTVTYPQDDLEAKTEQNGKWAFFHKDGRRYP